MSEEETLPSPNFHANLLFPAAEIKAPINLKQAIK